MVVVPPNSSFHDDSSVNTNFYYFRQRRPVFFKKNSTVVWLPGILLFMFTSNCQPSGNFKLRFALASHSAATPREEKIPEWSMQYGSRLGRPRPLQSLHRGQSVLFFNLELQDWRSKCNVFLFFRKKEEVFCGIYIYWKSRPHPLD